MVLGHGHMLIPWSVILALVPANVYVATQEIQELAVDVDTNGDGTLRVLTKPDLVDEGTEPRVIDLVEGRAKVVKLGWHTVRNLGQQHFSDDSVDRQHLIADFFRSCAPWRSTSADKARIKSLRDRLKEVLSALVRQEVPKVRLLLRTCH